MGYTKVQGCYIFILIVNYAAAECPTIISRSEWGARAPVSETVFPATPTHIIMHQSDSPVCVQEADCKAMMRSFQRFHIDTHHRPDIAYNFMIGEDGNVYEGVGWGYVGTHTKNVDNKSIGIAMIGDFSSRIPNEKAMEALEALIQCAGDENHLTSNYKLLGHRQVHGPVHGTECPGHKLYFHLRGMKNWSTAL